MAQSTALSLKVTRSFRIHQASSAAPVKPQPTVMPAAGSMRANHGVSPRTLVLAWIRLRAIIMVATPSSTSPRIPAQGRKTWSSRPATPCKPSTITRGTSNNAASAAIRPVRLRIRLRR